MPLLYTVGIAYIDEIIVYPRFVSLHTHGVVLFCAVVGLAIACFGSLSLSVYVDPWTETDKLGPHSS